MQTDAPTFFRYRAVRPEDEKWGLYLTGAGCAVIKPGDRYPSVNSHPDFYDFDWSCGRRLAEFHLVFITKGSGEFQAEHQPVVPVADDSVLWLPAGRWHRYRPSPSTGWTEYWVSFNGDIPRHHLEAGIFNSEPLLLQSLLTQPLQAIFQRLLGRLKAEPTAPARLLAADVFELLAHTSGVGSQTTDEANDHPAPASSEPLVSEALAIIWSRGREALSVSKLVEQMLVARRTLERAFRRELGHGVHEEILRCRLERTKRLLADQSLSIDQIAMASGFGNVRSLRRSFTAAEGVSPQAYRRVTLNSTKVA